MLQISLFNAPLHTFSIHGLYSCTTAHPGYLATVFLLVSVVVSDIGDVFLSVVGNASDSASCI